MTFEQLHLSKPLDQYDAKYSYEETMMMIRVIKDIPRHEDTENLVYAVSHFGNVAAIMEWQHEASAIMGGDYLDLSRFGW